MAAVQGGGSKRGKSLPLTAGAAAEGVINLIVGSGKNTAGQVQVVFGVQGNISCPVKRFFKKFQP